MIENLTMVILAGGQARRMNGEDKGLIPINGLCSIERIIRALSNQVKHIVINANANTDRYAAMGYPVISDEAPGYQGPLIGILTALRHAPTPFMLTVPCDAPMQDGRLITIFISALNERHKPAYVAYSRDKIQPVFTLLSKTTLSSLEDYIATGGRKVKDWLNTIPADVVDFSHLPNLFLNMNTPRDFAIIQQHIISIEKKCAN